MSSVAGVNLGAVHHTALKTMSMNLVDLFADAVKIVVANSFNVF